MALANPEMSSGEIERQSVERAIKAVETILNPLASSQERASANQYCEGVKGNFGEALQLAFTFVPFGNGYPLAIRQFGLNLLEHVSKHLSLDRAGGQALLEEGRFLERLWGLGMGPCGLAADVDESAALKEKMGVVFVQTAVRVWPQRWPALLDMLREEMGPLGQGPSPSPRAFANGELGLIVMRMLVEEIHAAADADVVVAWDESRRAELQSALGVVLPSFAEWLWRALPVAASSSSPADARSMRVLAGMVKAFGAVCQWVPLSAESTPLAVGTLFNILQAYQGSVREDVLEALMVFSTRQPRTGEEHLYGAIMDQELGHFEAILSAMAQAASTGDEAEEAYGELKRLAEVLLNLATVHLGSKKHPAVPKQLGRLYQVLLGLTDLPSLVIKSLGFIFWGALLTRASERVTTGHPDFAPLLPALLSRLIAGMAADTKAERRLPWNRLDFDDPKEFDEVASVTVNRISGILQQLAGRHPAASLGCLRAALMAFISEPQTRAALASSALPNDRFMAQWMALCGATEAIARGAKDEALSAELNGLLAGVLGLVEPAQSHPEVVASWLNAVKGLAVSLGIRLEASGPLLTGLLGLAFSYKNPLRTDLGRPDPLEVTIKGRSSSALLKLAATSPALFLPHLDELMRMFQQALTNGSAPIQQRRRLFTEIFLVLAAEIPEQQKRTDIIEQVLRPVFDELDAMAPWLSSLDALRTASGIASHLAGQPSSPDSAAFRKSLSNLLALVYLVVTRVAPNKPSTPLPADAYDYIRMTVLPRLHGFLAGLLSLLSKLAQPGAWPSQAAWTQFYDCQAEEPNVKATFESAMEDVNTTGGLETLRGWLSTIHVSALVSMGLTSTLPGFYEDFDLTQAYILASFNAPGMTLTSLTWTWKHLLAALLINCKSVDFLQARAALLDRHCLGPTFARLQHEWARLEADKLDDAGSPDLAAEMQREAQLVSLSSHLVSTLYDLLCPVAERDRKTAEPCLCLVASAVPAVPVESPVARWFMAGDLGRQSALLGFLVASLGWRASVGWGKALTLILRWLPAAVTMNQAIAHGLHTTLLPRLLRILAQPDQSDHHSAAAHLFCELYKWTVFLGLPSLEPALLSLPGITPPALAAYHQALVTAPPKTLKAQKEATRVLLKPWQAEAAKEFSGKAFRVGKMPEKLVLLRKLKAVPDENEVTADDIDNLFNA